MNEWLVCGEYARYGDVVGCNDQKKKSIQAKHISQNPKRNFAKNKNTNRKSRNSSALDDPNEIIGTGSDKIISPDLIKKIYIQRNWKKITQKSNKLLIAWKKSWSNSEWTIGITEIESILSAALL